MKIEPEAESLIGSSVSPALLKLGTIQWVFSADSALLLHLLPILLVINIDLVPSILLLYASLS